MRGVDQIFLHVGGEGVEDQRAAGGKAENDQESPGMMFEDFAQRAGFLARTGFGRGRLGESRAQKQRNHREDSSDKERDTPSPSSQFGVGQHQLNNQDHQ